MLFLKLGLKQERNMDELDGEKGVQFDGGQIDLSKLENLPASGRFFSFSLDESQLFS